MKRFYNNTLIGGACSKALRVVALLCVLLGVSSSAWGETYYLWYGSNDDYNNNSYQWSDGVSFSNNKGTFTITTSYWNCYVYIAKGSKSKSNLLKTPKFANPTTSTGVSNLYQGNRDGYNRIQFSTGTEASKSFTIECDFSNSSEYTFKVNTGSSSGGGAGGCTPSATITGASYDGTQITLSGSLTETCGKDTYYGWQYNTDGKTWGNVYVPGALNNAHHSQTAINSYTQTWKGFEKGKTYYFRAYAYQGEVFYSDGKVLSVKIPAEGSGEADCDNIIYLNPGVWEHTDGQRYAAYFFNGTSSDVWVDMVATTSGGECAGLYYVKTPDGGYKNVLFGRMNPNRSDNSFTHKDNGGPMYNQTKNCTLTEGKNLYSITGWNDGDDSKSGVGTPTESNCTDGCIPAEQPSTNVLLAREAIIDKNAKTAKLFGYLKATDCNVYTDYGFYYCTVDDGDAPCIPNTSSTQLKVDPSAQLKRGTEFSATAKDLEDGKTYYYRAYATSDEGTILSGEIRSFATDPCIPQYGGLSDKYNGKPIVYTINADPAFAANDCKLHFKSLQDAIVHLRNTANREKDYAYVTNDNGSYNLNQPVVMNVVYYDDTPENPASAYIYRGTENVGIYAGDNKPANANLIQDFNKSANADPANTLTIKAGTKVAKPWIHHLVIRNSRNIVLDSLCIYSDPNKVGDNALEIDVNSNGWDGMTTGQFADANIVIQNSMIGSDGFTGVHVSAYDGITFKKNDFEIVFEGNTDGNVLNWSASAKFMMCKNIKFIQNNFRGSQPTMLWLQECQNALFMNNVFWNTNTFVPADGSKAVVPSAVRLVSQYANEIDNIGFYYNTFYFANNDIDAPWAKYNFFNQYLAYTNGNQANIGKYGSNIYFKYNNCYSYDKDCPGMYDVVGSATGGGADMTYTTVTATSDSENFCPNNFWSQYDQDRIDKGETVTKSAFAFGCSDNDFVNVKGQVCETTASGPASLIVKGNDLNSGVKPDVDFTNIQLTDEEKYSDRYLQAVRPQDGEGWTFGAYQSKSAIPTTTIYWVGVTDKWDDRNNWEYEVTDADGKVVRQRVSCVNQLSSNLKVVIEEIGTVEVSGGRKWPKVPASFNAADRTDESSVPEAEQVSAGLGVINTPTKYASTIELEYGAGLRGVENLNVDGTRRYDKAIVHFDADREKWLLVGTVVKPFVDENDTDGDVRNVKSGDYFKDFLPQVYMRETTIDAEGNVSWTKTFSDLDTYVTPNSVFAIDVRDKYGPNFLSAETYNAQNGTSYDGKALIPYRFAGRFAVEAEKANDKEVFAFTVQPGVKNLLNNNYPCNIDAVAIEEAGLGTINLYDYVKGSFVCTDAKGDSYTAQDSAANAIPPVAYIKAQNGFVFTPIAGLKELVISDYLVEGSTRTRSTERELPTFSLDIDNANTTAPGASNVVVRYDEEMDVTIESPLNTPKVFTKTMDTPEAYIMHNDSYYSRLYVGNGVTRIPLGIRLRKAMNVTFQKVYNKGFSSMILLDTQTGKEYDLLTRSYTTNLLPKGDTEGRFYLVFSVIPEDEYLPDDDMTTGVDEEVETANADINIYTVNGNTIRVVTNDVNLQTIYVSDMVGRTAKYDAEGNFAEIELPVVNGVYTVQVIGDKLTRNEKVIIK